MIPRALSLTIRSIVCVHANAIERTFEGSRRGCGPILSVKGAFGHQSPGRAVHAVAGRGVRGLSASDHGLATTIKLARILKLEDWDGLRSIPNLEGFDPGSE